MVWEEKGIDYNEDTVLNDCTPLQTIKYSIIDISPFMPFFKDPISFIKVAYEEHGWGIIYSGNLPVATPLKKIPLPQ